MGSAVDQDGDGHLSELVTGEGEYLGAPQRTELADGEDLVVGRPRLGCPPVAARVDGLGSMAFVPAFVMGPGLAGSARTSDVTVWLALRRRPGWHSAYGRFRRQACNCPTSSSDTRRDSCPL